MSTTLTLSRAGIDALRAAMAEEGFSFSSLDHGWWQARGRDVVVNAYRSGKVVVQGKGESEFLRSHGHADPPAMSLSGRVAGSDESGKGDYFGPLVVAATVVEPGQVKALADAGVRDSKLMSDSSVLRAAVAVRATLPHAVRVLMPPEYNDRHEREKNVALFLATLHAEVLAEAMGRASGPCELVVIDQFTFASRLQEALARQGVKTPVEIRPRAEDNPAVAAASVLARAEFLITLKELSAECGYDLPKGAGTPVDAVAREMLAAGGRKLLASVAKIHFKTTQKAAEGGLL